MIPNQTFHCPRCGAPGQIQAGVAEYSCVCRLGQQQAPIFTHTALGPPTCGYCRQPMFPGHICSGSGIATTGGSGSATASQE